MGESLVCFLLHRTALHQFPCGIALLKTFAGANAVRSLKQISPHGCQPNLVDLTLRVNQNTHRLLCITNVVQGAGWKVEQRCSSSM